MKNFPRTMRRSPSAVFLDRDGIINKKPSPHDYVKSWGEFEFIAGIFPALKKIREKGYLLFIITNQAGVARGILNLGDLEEIHARMVQEFQKRGVPIAKVYFCPHGYHESCECRKPKPGMLREAAKDFGLDLKNSYLVGDSKEDIEAGKSVGCRTVLVLTGETKRRSEIDAWDLKPDFVIAGLGELEEILPQAS